MRDWMRFMPFRYKISDFFSILLVIIALVIWIVKSL